MWEIIADFIDCFSFGKEDDYVDIDVFLANT